MNMKGKIDLYAEIRHEYRWGVGIIRGLAEMFKVHRRLVRDALDNPLPPKRKIPLRLLVADRDVPYSQKHSAPSIHHQIQHELAGLRVAGSTVRGYVRKRKIELGLGSQRVDLAAALELSRNQITHFYSNKKNTQEMIKITDLLLTQYCNCKTIYLSWGAASWHISKDLFDHIERRNNEGLAEGYPIV